MVTKGREHQRVNPIRNIMNLYEEGYKWKHE